MGGTAERNRQLVKSTMRRNQMCAEFVKRTHPDIYAAIWRKARQIVGLEAKRPTGAENLSEVLKSLDIEVPK